MDSIRPRGLLNCFYARSFEGFRQKRKMTLRERVHWLLRMSIMLFILASVAFLSALTAMRYAIQGREVTVPNLVGKPENAAKQILQIHRLGLQVEDRIHDSLPDDAVLRQSPPPNTTAKVGQFVHVVLSLGPQREDIPQLEGESLRVARIELLQSGMQVGEISSAYFPGQPDEEVLEQDPAAGTADVTASRVDLLVSLAPSPPGFVMPDLVGLPLAEAETKLSGAGLKIARLVPLSVPGTLHDVVVDQTPSRGRRVDSATTIDLQVAQ